MLKALAQGRQSPHLGRHPRRDLRHQRARRDVDDRRQDQDQRAALAHPRPRTPSARAGEPEKDEGKKRGARDDDDDDGAARRAERMDRLGTPVRRSCSSLAVTAWFALWPSLEQWVGRPAGSKTDVPGAHQPRARHSGRAAADVRGRGRRRDPDRRDREADRLLKQFGEVLGVIDEAARAGVA